MPRAAFTDFVFRKAYGIPDKPDPQRDEIVAITKEVAGKLAETIPENNYWAFSAYTLLIPEILSNLTTYALPQPESISSVWNQFDAVCQGFTGIQQLFDQKTHRPVMSKMKGVINIASSIQLATLTAIGATSLGPLAFAAGTGVSLLLSLDESFRQIRRLASPVYFVADSLAELNKLEDLIEQKQAALEKLQSLPDLTQRTKSGKLALKLAQSSLDELVKKRNTIQEQITAKMDVALWEDKDKKEEEKSDLVKLIQGYNVRAFHNQCRSFVDGLKARKTPTETQYGVAKKFDNYTKKKDRLTTAAAISDTILWGFAFTGMLLICIPGMQPAGVALIAAASACFLLKNSGKLLSKAPPIDRFFKAKFPKPKAPQIKEGEDEGEDAKKKMVNATNGIKSSPMG